MSRVLIVDDELPLLRNLKSFLSSCGGRFEPLTAADAETALGILETEDLDVLVTDVRLPGIDGIELVRRARQMRPGLPILVMTAFGSDQIRHAGVLPHGGVDRRHLRGRRPRRGRQPRGQRSSTPATA